MYTFNTVTYDTYKDAHDALMIWRYRQVCDMRRLLAGLNPELSTYELDVGRLVATVNDLATSKVSKEG